MKTIFPVLLAAFSCALLPQLMPNEIYAEEILPQVAPEENKASTQPQNNSPSSSGQTADSTEPSQVSQQTQSGPSTSPSETINEEVPPVFQVSPDPRDLVQFLVTNGIVTIQGSVGTRELARKLIKKYSRMPGVRQVRNRLTVRTNTDAEVARRVRQALSDDPDTRAGSIGVTVYDGIVYLSGVVSSAPESQRAEKLAQGLQGVKEVNNGLRLAGQIRQPAPPTSRVRTYPRR